jgi:hypothetical protein
MTRLPPVIATFMLVITQRNGSSKSNVGMSPVPLTRSLLHSIITHVELRSQIIDRDDDTVNPDSIPLSPNLSQWKAQTSTIHIDPGRDKETPLRHSGDTQGAALKDVGLSS